MRIDEYTSNEEIQELMNDIDTTCKSCLFGILKVTILVTLIYVIYKLI